MKDKKKIQKYIPLLTTLLLHAAIILLLAFVTLKIADNQEDEESGVSVLLGYAADSSGENKESLPEESEPIEENFEETEAEQTISETAEETVEETDVEPSITQQAEETIAIQDTTEEKQKSEEDFLKEEERLRLEEETRIREAEEEGKRKAEEEARRKAEEEEAKRKAAAAIAQNKISGAFGKTNSNKQENSGNTKDDGNQGTANGNAVSGTISGNGGIGTDAVVGSRSVLHLEKPAYNDHTSEGTIVVAIVVNKAGTVTSASIRRSFTTSTVLRNAAIEAAKKSKFSPGNNETEAGTITYRFKLRGTDPQNNKTSVQINM